MQIKPDLHIVSYWQAVPRLCHVTVVLKSLLVNQKPSFLYQKLLQVRRVQQTTLFLIFSLLVVFSAKDGQ
jgi:hypothetical protein